jgi:hypothetical protein
MSNSLIKSEDMKKNFIFHTNISGNRIHRVGVSLRKFDSYDNQIPKYVSIFIYPLSFPCFIFTSSRLATRLFTDEFSLKVVRRNGYTNLFSFPIRKVQAKRHAVLDLM